MLCYRFSLSLSPSPPLSSSSEWHRRRRHRRPIRASSSPSSQSARLLGKGRGQTVPGSGVEQSMIQGIASAKTTTTNENKCTSGHSYQLRDHHSVRVVVVVVVVVNASLLSVRPVVRMD
uniref:Uncharacterized protein n=1 Tax=Odontella aurita TaxID=265563 RepID=A0A7S4JM09_9STRA